MVFDLGYGHGRILGDLDRIPSQIHRTSGNIVFLYLIEERVFTVIYTEIVLGSGEGHSISEALHRIVDRTTLKTGEQVSVESIEPPQTISPIEERCFIADSESFSRITGWEPEVSLSEGIDRTLEAFL